MICKHKMGYLAALIVLLLALSWSVGGMASSMDSTSDEDSVEVGNEYNLGTGVDAALLKSASQGEAGGMVEVSAAGEIIPAGRKIDWSYAGIPGGIPERTSVCATIDSAVYGNGTKEATDAIQKALDSCPDGQVVYVPQGTYIVNRTIHLYDYDTLRGAGPGKTILKHPGGYFKVYG